MNRIPIRRASLVLLAACSLLGLTAGRALAQLPNPAAYLKFDEGQGTLAKDSSGNGHDANLIGAAGWTAGIIGPFALNLPGVSGAYAQIPGPVLDTLQSFSVTAWVKLNNTNAFQTFVSEDTSVESAFFLQLRGDSGQFSFTVPYGFFLNPQSGFNPVVGQWYHLAGVYDAVGRSASLYVNGVLTDTIYNVVPNQGTGDTAMGRGQFNSNQVDWNNGAIDDVQLYQQALTADQVLKIAQEGNPSLTGPGPIEPATLSIDGSRPGAKLNPRFYGLMVEEINHAFDGGIYGELIQNRVLKDDQNVPVHWSILPYDDGSISLDTNEPVPNTALTTSLRVQVNKNRVRVANDGYYGFPIEPATVYRASFWAKAAPGFDGPITVSLTSS
ncbi:MAG: LamG domain-containing protein, partial [Verrucomicrobia bacterium]|nr:LamG domain-containing protein [Verrucomicrobiota bacterium]